MEAPITELFAYYPVNDPGDRLTHAGTYTRFPTVAAAEEFAAKFPKSCGLRVGGGCDADGTRYGVVTTHVNLYADGVNGGVNETGVKRLKRFLRDTPFVVKMNAGNSATPEKITAELGVVARPA